jgi:hypothetical protein
MTARSTCEVRLELSNFHYIFGMSLKASELTIEKSPDGTERFIAKVPIESCYKRNVWAEALKLEGTANHDSLVIDYQTNDAMGELDHGRVQLRRVLAN